MDINFNFNNNEIILVENLLEEDNNIFKHSIFTIFRILTSILIFSYGFYYNFYYENYFNIVDIRIIISTFLIIILGVTECSVWSNIYNKPNIKQIISTIFLLITEILNRIYIKNENINLEYFKDNMLYILYNFYYLFFYINLIYFLFFTIFCVLFVLGVIILLILNYFNFINLDESSQIPINNKNIKKLFYSTCYQFHKFHIKKKEKFSKSFELFNDKDDLNYTNNNIVKKISKDICSICINNIKFNDISIKYPGCGHIFHNNCLINWLKINTIYPLCRIEFNI